MGVVERPPRSADLGDPRIEDASDPRRRFEEQQTQQMIDLHNPFGSAEQPGSVNGFATQLGVLAFSITWGNARHDCSSGAL
jgi:hypothetical protein